MPKRYTHGSKCPYHETTSFIPRMLCMTFAPPIARLLPCCVLGRNVLIGHSAWKMISLLLCGDLDTPSCFCATELEGFTSGKLRLLWSKGSVASTPKAIQVILPALFVLLVWMLPSFLLMFTRHNWASQASMVGLCSAQSCFVGMVRLFKV
jgi:hypothetical protein